LCFWVIWVAAISAAAESPSVVYVKWDSRLSPQLVDGIWRTGDVGFDAAIADFDVRKIRPAVQVNLKDDPFGLKRVLQLELARSSDIEPLINRLRGLPRTEYAEPMPVRYTDGFGVKDQERSLDNVPTDPLYPGQYFYPLMQAPAAWDLTRGDPSVVVAVVDNGCDIDHPDIAANIWINTGEIPDNGFDDDGNGFVDDVNGWDFQDEDNDPNPAEGAQDSHGTHTSGLVAALMNNGRGVVGMASSCTLMPVRAGEGGSIYYGIDGILYAAHNGADIISLSWGGPGSSSYEQDVISDAQLQGALIIAAAGNESSSAPHYPAGYEGVMSVANTSPNDELFEQSNYGTWIDVCAPGVSILSLVPGGYGLSTGTSMSTPLVAGIAALIKSLHPDWDADHIFSQILFTADNIEPLNPFYVGMIGTGRVNAYRAVAETAPGLQIVDLSVSETSGDFDGRLDPGESADLILSLLNNGSSTADVQVTLTSGDAAVQVTQGSWNFSQFAEGEIVANQSAPFQVYVQPWSYENYQVELTFTVQSENYYTASLTQSIWIAPTFADHDTGNVILTMTDFGAFGYYNYMHDEYNGSGFRFPREGTNALYLGSFMAGVSVDRISDCAYGDAFPNYRFDWQATDGGELTIFPGTSADQEGVAVYQDSRAPDPNRVGLEVTQHSYAWADPPNDDFIVLSFTLQNISGGTLDDLYAGLYMDWDLMDLYDNEADWDADNALGYVFNAQPLAPNTRYYGTTLLSHSPASYRVINDQVVPFQSSITDTLKYEFMSSGFVVTSSSGPSDQATLLSAGPFSLNDGENLEVVFAVLGGEDLSDLQENATAAKNVWNAIQIQASPAESVSSLRITGVFPRPANDALRIRFTTPGAGEVVFSVIDPLGRSRQVHRGWYASAGSYTVSLNRWRAASGVYFLRARSPFGESLEKILWLK
jgi:subtilisin family serine protease